DWAQRQARCPHGKVSTGWRAYVDRAGQPYTIGRFGLQDGRSCPARPLGSRTPETGRSLHLPAQERWAALPAARAGYASAEGRQRSQRRAGGEGTLSQGVRAFGLRRTRCRGVAKPHVPPIATAAAINVDRMVAWLEGCPRAKTRTARCAALAPA